MFLEVIFLFFFCFYLLPYLGWNFVLSLCVYTLELHDDVFKIRTGISKVTLLKNHPLTDTLYIYVEWYFFIYLRMPVNTFLHWQKKTKLVGLKNTFEKRFLSLSHAFYTCLWLHQNSLLTCIINSISSNLHDKNEHKLLQQVTSRYHTLLKWLVYLHAYLEHLPYWIHLEDIGHNLVIECYAKSKYLSYMCNHIKVFRAKMRYRNVSSMIPKSDARKDCTRVWNCSTEYIGLNYIVHKWTMTLVDENESVGKESNSVICLANF